MAKMATIQVPSLKVTVPLTADALPRDLVPMDGPTGEPVIDLWAGWADTAQTVPYGADTLTPVFSAGKAVMALLIATCVERGLLDYEQPVARYWPGPLTRSTSWYASPSPPWSKSSAWNGSPSTADTFQYGVTRGPNGVALHGGVINLADKNPPALPETYSGTGALPGASLYDNRGRFFFVGAKLSY